MKALFLLPPFYISAILACAQGNVGIGMPDPLYRLDVTSSGTYTARISNTGIGSSSTAVYATANSVINAGIAVQGIGGKFGVWGQSLSYSQSTCGVKGSAGSPAIVISGHYGVLGESVLGKGVVGVSSESYGVFGFSEDSWGIRAEGLNGALYGLSWGSGKSAIIGFNSNTSGETVGVTGSASSPDGKGIKGENSAATGIAHGVYGKSSSSSGHGVTGFTSSSTGATVGVFGQSTSTNGGSGVRAEAAYTGVYATTTGRWGVYAHSSGTANSYGIYATVASGTANYAGYFNGNVQVTGMLTKGGGSFKIDHPLDPANKYLYHSFVESPDMMNIYNGNVLLDANGTATVVLPDWFEALNKDFRYQLTCIGGFAQVFIAQKIQGNSFRIAGGKPGLEVSWMVTGVRHDAYANKHRIPVEELKAPEERGYYLHPDAQGKGAQLSVHLLKVPSPAPVGAQ